MIQHISIVLRPGLKRLAMVACATLLLIGQSHGACRLSGTVVNEVTRGPVSGATVSIPGATVVTGANGIFCFEEVASETELQLILSVIDNNENHVECIVEDVTTQYLPVSATTEDGQFAIQVAKPDAIGTIELVVRPVAQSEVESVCTSCHTWNPCYSEASPEVLAAMFDSSISGVYVYRSEKEQFLSDLREQGMSDEQYKSIRYTCIHARQIDMTEASAGSDFYQMPSSDLPLAQGGLTTCDTCHTRHEEAFGGYLRKAYEEAESPLCLECHK